MKFPDKAAIALAAGVVALVGARDYAGGWNDGSHLAAAESLVDRGTFIIDDSIFVRVPAERSPYAPSDGGQLGTRDRVYINGHFYSDKPPVVSMLLAAWYAALQWGLGLQAAADPRLFCWWLTAGSSGLAYVIAVWCMYGIGERLGLARQQRAALAISLAASTVALAYSRSVNQHELLLAVTAMLFLVLSRIACSPSPARSSWLAAGALAGLAYTFDQGAGPLLLACTLGLVCFRARRLGPVLLFGLAAVPAVALHHGVTWSIGGTLTPLGMTLDYLRWPGSPFDQANATGVLRHSPASFAVYAAAMLFGKKGFVLHNLPLVLLVPSIGALWWRGTRERPEIVAALCWCASTWLVYSLLSNNYSGGAVSIRWFVPLLVPAYFLLAVLVRDEPDRAAEFALLSGVGGLLAAIAWWRGPWTLRMLPLYWPIVATGLAGWIALRRRHNGVRLAMAAAEPNLEAKARMVGSLPKE
jgi:hypothetical protein